MDKKLFAKYVELDNQLKAIEEEKELLRDMIVLELKNAKIEKASTDYGVFTRAKRQSWEYTAKVAGLEEKVKIAKVKEQQSGKAKMVENEYLRFTPLKIEA